MADFDIYQLEDRIEELLDAYHRVQREKQALADEKAELAELHGQMRQRIQAVVKRIKSLEKTAEGRAA